MLNPPTLFWLLAAGTPTPVLAVDLDTIIFLLAGLFGVISWLYKVLTGQANQPQVGNRPRPPVKPRDPQVQREIDIFLEDVAPGRRPQAGPARPAEPVRPPVAAPPRKPVPRPARLAKPREAAKAQAAPAGRPQAPEKTARVRPGQEVAQRAAPGSRDLGAGVQQHLQQYMAEKISKEVSQHLPNRVQASVAEHLGSAAPATPPPTPQVAPAARIAAMMRNPESMRQAMIVSMVLAPRRRSSGANR